MPQSPPTPEQMQQDMAAMEMENAKLKVELVRENSCWGG